MYHGLDSNYRPWGEPDASPVSPASVDRVKQFTYGCATFAEEELVERAKAAAGMSTTRRVMGR
jgi:hypothetical protein